MNVVRVELKEANEFIESNHRHHKKVLSHRFSLGVQNKGSLIGVAICGRPVCRKTDQKMVLEVTRLCTDGTKNACSFLYARAAKIATLMGFEKIQTFILESENGSSLMASGWSFESVTKVGNWNSRDNRREEEHLKGPKKKYSKILKDN